MTAHLASDFLLDVYACARDAGCWRGVMDQICRQVGVRSAVVQFFDHHGERPRQRWAARDSISLAAAEMHDRFVNNETNPRLRHHKADPLRRRHILRDRERFPQGSRDLAELQRRLAAVGLGEAIGIGITLSETCSFSLLLHRSSEDSRGFDDGDEAFLRALLPHLEQVAQLADAIDRTQSEHAMLGDILLQLRPGIILCDPQRRIRWQNRAAETILQASPDLCVVQDRLCCIDNEDTVALAGLVVEPEHGPGKDNGPIMIGRYGDRPVQVMRLPLNVHPSTRRLATENGGPVALVLGQPGGIPAISVEDVADLFGLTRAEARLTVALCQGASVGEYASDRGIALGTARVQLKHALAKTRTHRQSELVRQICGSVMMQAIRT